MFSGGTLDGELHRTAERLVEIAEKQGIYFVIAYIYDLGYDAALVKKLLPILQHTSGSIKSVLKDYSDDN